ncbi:MAG TPA: hypothetical protein VHO28_02695 [Ignavibacteriales bacterium]|nr:hypothetical protein [Ignavibacteriales bacterium]
MNHDLLNRHIAGYKKASQDNRELFQKHFKERIDAVSFFNSWTADNIKGMAEEDMRRYLSHLTALMNLGNKSYMIDKVISDNGLDKLKENLASFVWGAEDIEKKWDVLRGNLKRFSPAMASEILCKTHPDKYYIWNRRSINGLNQLGATELPVYNYQITGRKYKQVLQTMRMISEALKSSGFEDSTYLAVHYFLCNEFPAENLSDVAAKREKTGIFQREREELYDFFHNDIRDAIENIGRFLGFETYIDKKVAEGSQVDTVWESHIGNIGRIVYAFEVQSKSSIDSLLMNLLQALNNPTVQGVIAVSNKEQLEKISKRASTIPNLREKIRFWDYEEILKIQHSLEFVNDLISKLKLVPEGF